MAQAPGDRKDGRPTFVWDWIAFVSAALVLIVGAVVERGSSVPLRVIGAISLVLSAFLIFPPFLLLSRHGGVPPGAPYYDTSRLVERGPYAVVRHPQYLGYILLVLGFALLAQHPLTALLGVVAIGSLYAHTALEERDCVRRLGDVYRTYMRRVPRFNLPLGLVRLIVRRRRATLRP
jgi:protein-S-isoprenylcysteine O-methyltransferase Ste14